MSMGRFGGERQGELWVAAGDLAEGPRHVFYDKLNELLREARFDDFAEELCGPFYVDGGRPGIPPGVYFRMLLVGYFEGIGSQRGIAWRCADSLSLKRFLGLQPHEATPDHSSLTRVRDRLAEEVFLEVFAFALNMAAVRKLLRARTVGVDTTTLEANAALKSIVRRDTGEDYDAFVRGIMVDEGVAEKPDQPTAEEVQRFDRKRKGKTLSNEDWRSTTDHDARILKMKDGRTRLGYKAEHVIDLETEFVLSARVYHGDRGDTSTIEESLQRAAANLPWADPTDEDEAEPTIENVAADKGYHANELLARLRSNGVRTYVPEPAGRRRWTDKPPEQRDAVYANRRRTRGHRGRRLQRLRSERVERSFAHVCDTGGARRSWLRGLEKANKRYLMAAMAHNLGLVMRKLFGTGKPREFADRCAAILASLARRLALHTALHALRAALSALATPTTTPHRATPRTHPGTTPTVTPA